MKVKTKILIVTMITLFTALIGATNVKAVDVTEETLQQMIDVIPESMNIDLKESECRKATTEIEKQVKQIWQEKGIDTTEIEISDIWASPISFGKEEFYKGCIEIQKSGDISTRKSKVISITYNNTNRYNLADEQTVKNLKIESLRYFEVDIDFTNTFDPKRFFAIIGENYTNQINDESITVIAEATRGGGVGLNMWTAEVETIGIFKNGVLYDFRKMGEECTVPVITVPNSVAETEINNYIINILEENVDELKKVISITKGATINGYSQGELWTEDVKDGYTVKATFNYDGWDEDDTVDSYIIVRKEKSAVATTDTETNIKLEANTDIIPSDTVLEVKPIEKSNITVLEDTVNNFVAYDITLKSNGVEIQPNGNVRIKIPVPEGFDTSKLVVYRIDGNNKIKYNVTVETIDSVKYAVFETDHFSTYILGQMKEAISNKGELDETPKTGIETDNNIMLYVLEIIAILSVLVLTKEIKK